MENGYRLKGRWNFASGLDNANWLFCPSLVMDGESPLLSPAGTPVTRTMWIPASSASSVDTWSVMGMRGTGSHDFVVDDVFVPEFQSICLTDPSSNPGPLYHPRFFFALAHLLFAGNSLGIARSSIKPDRYGIPQSDHLVHRPALGPAFPASSNSEIFTLPPCISRRFQLTLRPPARS